MITGVWIHEQGDMVAVQLDEDSILIVDYREDPSIAKPVGSLDDAWRELIDVSEWHT